MEEQKQGWFSKLKAGLSNTSAKLSSGITSIFTKRKLDQEALDELEELLITTDIGVDTASKIVGELAKNRFDKEITPEEIKQTLASYIADILNPVTVPLTITNSPQVIVICGVNGNGKTTTIGKLASYYKSQGKSVCVAACDTFRAAAVNQLEIWANRAGCKIFKGEDNADPASVAFRAISEAKTEGIDIVFIDTAGRLQNKTNLMEELAKIIRVIKKVEPEAPHNTLLVLDATTGQNAHSQVEAFKSVVNLTGLIVTKLDGTAKGGVIVALAKKFGLPIHAIGVGEGIEDLRPFNPEDFAKSLVG
jgi:fused signal recognition particle receptor